MKRGHQPPGVPLTGQLRRACATPALTGLQPAWGAEAEGSLGPQRPQGPPLTVPPQPEHGQQADGQRPSSLPATLLQREDPTSKSQFADSPEIFTCQGG